jgi:hypothetical protein
VTRPGRDDAVMADQLPPYCAHIAHRVEHPDRWKAGFDDLEPGRRAAGILGHHINRAVDDPHVITVFLALVDPDVAARFTSTYAQGEVMQTLGIESPPMVEWVQPIRGAVVSHRQLPAFLLRRRVVDFDTWLAGYDTAVDLHHTLGIIGHAISRSLDDPLSITIYHQAESFDALHGFLVDPTTQSGMLEGDVSCELAATFHTGGWAKTY